MSVQRFKSLLFRSSRIQEEIEREHSRRWPDWLRLLKLKKLRLAIKDKMQQLARDSVFVSGSYELQTIRISPRHKR